MVNHWTPLASLFITRIVRISLILIKLVLVMPA